jgi:hypothetical protein
MDLGQWALASLFRTGHDLARYVLDTIDVKKGGRIAMPHFIHKDNFIALRKGCESYLFFYDDDDVPDTSSNKLPRF